MSNNTSLSCKDNPRILIAQKNLNQQFIDTKNIIARVSNIHDFTNTVIATLPDVVIFEQGLSGGDSLATAEYLKYHYPEIKMIYLCQDLSSLTNFREKSHCMDGLLLNSTHSGEIQWAIKKVLTGKTFISPKLRQSLTDEASNDVSFNQLEKERGHHYGIFAQN